ncbi:MULTISPECIES: AroM family protein [Tenebrionibacter/Tenebrionicola group]|jgi:protein AroM|uniref:AroM family protein n=2 Tax=Tenebrionibacter/Tenebrionicola group TaxID=2969848 RepID=A0A8K0V1M7_9ENTR|nr:MULTISPECIES: AroM family protein [Tenebrionibacter/Tenebrionicola group]MBK4715809.1 AroM family protein [Tenebrionibacter intestinalis]MBV4412780.1 AroM family protein [Tenebrionicola larvae]MBV5096507.1 AroM family protein [Tenebrionicola larvae]
MNTPLAIVTVGAVSDDDIMSLLTEHIPEQYITHLSLLGRLTSEEALEDYGASEREETLLARLRDGALVSVSHEKVELALQAVIEVLEAQGYGIIMVLNNGRFSRLNAHKALLLVPDRIVPPLVASIVEGHQVGILLLAPEQTPSQRQKWQALEMKPLYGPSAPPDDDAALVRAGDMLKTRGADVLVLDCLGFHPRHRDLLQKTLGIPVLLSHMLIARLASELMI